MATIPDLTAYPLCEYFLSGYLQKTDDPTNFPPDQYPDLFVRYESILKRAITVLGLSREALRKRTEFNFDCASAQNLESGIAILRTVALLDDSGFKNIGLVTVPKGVKGADILAEKKGHRTCFEVKAITKQSAGRKDEWMEEQLYLKVLEFAPNAAKQLAATAAKEGCEVRILVCVLNWFEQSIYLTQQDYQGIVNKLESFTLDGYDEQRSLSGIDGVWFLPKFGSYIPPFLNDVGKLID
jgi:hypothetical protein